GEKIAITGSNGSGKSTFLKCLAGQQPLSEGEVIYFYGNQTVPESEQFKLVSFSAPYLELPEEFTLKEFLIFHFKFKPLSDGLSIPEIISIMYLDKSADKSIANFSSGMKQRLKLGICFLSKSPLILLDEPTSNLDAEGVDWYLHLIETYSDKKSLIIGSNDQREYSFCNQKINVEDFKPKGLL
ncbi:MAG TPA: ATP-binding cassette domain-containing protein, partial [Lunatimonas sp.]|nr:ATP-binding cassette domain-containing protein [Lunatimonas sp.]